MRKPGSFGVIIMAVIVTVFLFNSCQSSEDLSEPIVMMEVKSYGDGVFLLDATNSVAVEEIRWSMPGVINDTIWEDFMFGKAKAIQLPDINSLYELTVTARNSVGEVSETKTIKAEI